MFVTTRAAGPLSRSGVAGDACGDDAVLASAVAAVVVETTSPDARSRNSR